MRVLSIGSSVQGAGLREVSERQHGGDAAAAPQGEGMGAGAGEDAGPAAGAVQGDAQGAAQANGVVGDWEEGCVWSASRAAPIVFLCGHMCVCEQCAADMQACPICRRRSRPIRVYPA